MVGRIDVDEGGRAGDVPGRFDRLVIVGKPRAAGVAGTDSDRAADEAGAGLECGQAGGR